MIYTTTDVLCCFPGIGRTTFSTDQNKGGSTFCLDMDGEGYTPAGFAQSIADERKVKEYRYILTPVNELLFQSLYVENVPFLIVAPHLQDVDVLVKAWMQKGATVETVIARLERLKGLRELESKFRNIIYLQRGEWLGNILEQTRASAEDGKDV